MAVKAKYLSLSLVATAVVALSPAMADQTFRVCIGEYEHMCPTPKQAWFPCGTPAEAAARSVCTIYTANGQTVKPFRMLRQYDVSGNRCGYYGMDVTCSDQ
jgi:hypothetical protein